ncbi:MAG: glycosyltransferase family 2 protein [Jatrophihabitans sp.]
MSVRTGRLMSIRVSVIVATYNTGEHIERLIDSLGRQSLPPGEFEVIFVDDGSTDETPARLDRLAAERDNVIVLHGPNSGWPGRPRNLGMDVARGKYLFFADHDDWFGTEALERLVDYADVNRSDVVIGRYAGHHRGVAKALFAQSRPIATLENAPLMDSLTPHKLFRAAFVTAVGLRFPEGKRRLEDHVFVVESYFRAERISVLGDYHCYFHVGRSDAGNAGYQRIDPPSYYGYVREVIEIIERNTEPGPLRERCLRRPLRQEVLARLDGASFLAQDRDYQRQLFDEARAVAEEAIPRSVDDGLSPPQRVRAALLRANRFDDLVAYVAHQVGVRSSGRLTDLSWDAAGQLVLDVEGSLVERDTGAPWRYRCLGDRVLLTTPALMAEVPLEALDCTAQLHSGQLQVVARRRKDSEEWPVPTESTVEIHRDGESAWLSYRATARLAPRTLGGGRSLTSGVWDFYVRTSQTGWSKESRLGADRSERATAGRHPAVISGTTMLPYWTESYDNLSLDVAASGKTTARHVLAGATSGGIRLQDGALQLNLRLAVVGDEPLAVALQLRSGANRVVELEPGPSVATPGVVTLTAPLPPLKRGVWQVLLALDVPRWGAPRPTGSSIRVGRATAPTVIADDEVAALVRRTLRARLGLRSRMRARLRRSR